jgi:hypothetical protein
VTWNVIANWSLPSSFAPPIRKVAIFLPGGPSSYWKSMAFVGCS